MSKARAATDQIVKLIVGAGQASPSPPVGPALGSKGVKSMDFCKVRHSCRWSSQHWVNLAAKPFFLPSCTRYTDSLNLHQEFNARTAHMVPGTPTPARVTVRPDRSFHFEIRTPTTAYLLLSAAQVELKKGKLKGSSAGEVVGTVSLKHVFEIAKIKQSELRLSGLSLEGLCKSVIAQAKSVGVKVVV